MRVRPPLIEEHDGRDAFVNNADELGHGQTTRHINIHARRFQTRRRFGQFQPGRLELLAVAAHAAEELDQKTAATSGRVAGTRRRCGFRASPRVRRRRGLRATPRRARMLPCSRAAAVLVVSNSTLHGKWMEYRTRAV